MNLRRGHGFTLVEMMVAVALLSLVSLAMFESLRFAQRTYGKINRAEATVTELAMSQHALRALIESAYPFANDRGLTGAPRNLVGGKNEISFSAPTSQANGALGFDRYSVVLRRTPNGLTYDVVARWWMDRNGQPPLSEAAVAEEVLVSDVTSLEWAYLMSAGQGQTAPSGYDQAWLDEWRERDRLPAAVRVRVKYAREDARRWPDLVIASRITDDANCEFDVVSQDCRRVH